MKKNEVKEDKAELIKSIKEDLYRRQLDRKKLEMQWKLNLNFLSGNQYSTLNGNDEIIDSIKRYDWEEKKVYNHLSGLLEVRQSKLCANKPTITVIPASSDSKDMATARTCQSICQSLWHKNRLSELIAKAISWSESCGTVFYKVTWNSELGDVLLNENGKEIYSGDVKIDVVSPFEIFPQNIAYENLEDNESIIHARAFTVTKIKDMYGIDVKGEKIDSFGIMRDDLQDIISPYKANAGKIQEEEYALVIEKYILPTREMPNGRLIIICGEHVCYDGELPYINVTHKKRGYPFIRQIAYPLPGCFFGISVVERAIPLQKDYNALKNRKMEFLNRLCMGVLLAEDGAVDIDNIEEEGLEPGKVIVYRQGANPPMFMPTNNIPVDFDSEETRIINEFSSITGVNDLIRQGNVNVSNISGTALQILLEQETARLSVSADSIGHAVCEIATQVLRLYKQFATFPRILKLVGEKGSIDAICFSSRDITTDDVVIDNQSETITTKAQQRSLIFEILSSGVLQNEEGKLSNTTRQKIIDMLGLGIYDMGNDITSLQLKYAQKENIDFTNGKTDVFVQEIDDHDMHIKEHSCLLLGAEGDRLRKNGMYEKVMEHIREHKKFKSLTN